MARKKTPLDRFDEILPQLRQLFKLGEERPEFDDLLAAVTDQNDTRTICDALKALKAAFENRHTWLQTQVVPKLMEEQDTVGQTITGIGRVNLRDDVYVKVPQANREAVYEWLRDVRPDIMTETANSSTLAAFVRQSMKKGEPLHEGISITPYTKAVITRAKQEEKL